MDGDGDGCPTACAPSCVFACHQWHLQPWLRDHDPIACDGHVDDSPDLWARSPQTAPAPFPNRALDG